jgi:hypothetical protein
MPHWQVGPRVSGQDSENRFAKDAVFAGFAWIWPIERGQRWAARIKIKEKYRFLKKRTIEKEV